MFKTDPSAYTMRGRALECLGHIAIAIGKDNFAPYFDAGMRCALQNMELHDDALNEYSYIFIANAAKVMGNAFDSHLEMLVPQLLNVITEPEIVSMEDEDDEEEGEGDAHGGDEDEDEDDEGGDVRLNVMEGFVHTKKAALSAIGALAQYTGAAFFPFLANSLNAVFTEPHGVSLSLHSAIRSEGFAILPQLLAVACDVHGPKECPAKGEAVQLDQLVAEVCRVSLNLYVSAMEDDSEKIVVSHACEGVIGLLDHVGMSALSNCDDENRPLMDRLMSALLVLVQEKGLCQTAAAKDKDDEDDSSHDNVVMDSVVDLIGTLAKKIGPAFAPYFERFIGPLLRFTKPSRSYSDRAMSVGCFGEVIDEIGAAAAGYADWVLPLIHAGLNDEMESVRRNSAFCLAALCTSAGPAISQHYGQMLQWLRPLCIRPPNQLSTDTGGADIDNALSAVARMIKIAPAAVPLPLVLPVMLDALPLRVDMLETTNVYGCLVLLLQSGEATALSLLPKILNIFAQVIHESSKAAQEAKDQIVSCIKMMAVDGNYRVALTNAFQQIEDLALRSVIERAIQS